MDKVRREGEFVLTARPAYMETKRLMVRDPETVAIWKTSKVTLQFRTEVSFESLLVSWNLTESVVAGSVLGHSVDSYGQR